MQLAIVLIDMRTAIFILLFLTALQIDAQTHHESTMPYEAFIRTNTPINLCGRPWMMSEERMDSLVLEIKALEDTLDQLDFVNFADTSSKYILLYASDHTFRIEFDGETSNQFCVTDSVRGETIEGSVILKAASGPEQSSLYFPNSPRQQLKLYDNTFLTISSVHYYLGNCQFWTTRKIYCIREDEYENYVKP